jgi:hypothetical protein
LGFFAAGAAADTAVSTAAQSAASIVATTLQVAGEVFCAVVWITKYGWIYMKQTQNDNLTSDLDYCKKKVLS